MNTDNNTSLVNAPSYTHMSSSKEMLVIISLVEVSNTSTACRQACM